MKKAKPKRVPERVILKLILEWLRLYPEKCLVRRINVSGVPISGREGRWRKNSEMLGMPDIIGIWNKRPLAIEVKARGNKTSELQAHFLASWRSHGGIAIVAYSLDDVMNRLNEEDGYARENIIDLDYVVQKTRK